MVTFAGVVRDHDGGRGVVNLDYEGHPSAKAVDRGGGRRRRRAGTRACARSRSATGSAPSPSATWRWRARWPPSTAQEAFAACADLVDDVKRRLPIWKHQNFTDGTDEWVNCP